MVDHVNRAGGNAFCWVNPHYLENIVRLSDGVDIRACNDIVDDSGMTLWPRGGRVSRDLHARVQTRRLRRPLEASLDAAAGASLDMVWHDCSTLMAGSPTLGALGASAGTHGLLRALRHQHLPASVSLLLTSARAHQRHSYDTSLAAMIVAAGLGFACGLTDHDTTRLMLAALVHDIGEIYINPAYLDPSRRLHLREWKHVATHPCVGQAFLREFTDFPAAITDCVLHHHERLDGSGYPFAITGQQLGLLDKLMCVADTVAAIVVRGGPAVERRVLAALRLLPHEFPPPAVTFITRRLGSGIDAPMPVAVESSGERTTSVSRQLEAARREVESILANGHGPALTGGMARAAEMLLRLDQRLRITGVCDASRPGNEMPDAAERDAIELTLDEIQWRLRSLARSLYLQTEQQGSPLDVDALANLLAVLDPASSVPS